MLFFLFHHPRQVGLLPHGHKMAAATPGTKSLHEQKEAGGKWDKGFLLGDCLIYALFKTKIIWSQRA